MSTLKYISHSLTLAGNSMTLFDLDHFYDMVKINVSYCLCNSYVTVLIYRTSPIVLVFRVILHRRMFDD